MNIGNVEEALWLFVASCVEYTALVVAFDAECSVVAFFNFSRFSWSVYANFHLTFDYLVGQGLNRA